MLLSDAELRSVEREYANGITCQELVTLFNNKGERFTTATLRKYVQLGLLPTSRREGISGQHTGSRGVYPVIVVFLINEIKRAVGQGAGLNDVKCSGVWLAGEVCLLEDAISEFLGKLARAVDGKAPRKSKRLVSDLGRSRESLAKEILKLNEFILRLG